jgi:acetamidase/formamidase
VVATHAIPLERRTLHGHFSRELPPVLEVDSGDSIVFSTLDAGWGNVASHLDEHGLPRHEFEPRDAELDAGHPLIGPVIVRDAHAGGVLEVRVDDIRVGPYGITGAQSGDAELLLRWTVDADTGTARDDRGRTVSIRPFLGVLGMPPDEKGIHSTGPPRQCGGNIDCKELVVGSTLFLPISVDGALFSAGDGHAAQGDGEISGSAIECPLSRVQLTLVVRNDLALSAPLARTSDSWISFGFHEDLDEAVVIAVEGILDVMVRELSTDRLHAIALASVVVDLRVTQIVNGERGIHAELRDAAIR